METSTRGRDRSPADSPWSSAGERERADQRGGGTSPVCMGSGTRDVTGFAGGFAGGVTRYDYGTRDCRTTAHLAAFDG